MELHNFIDRIDTELRPEEIVSIIISNGGDAVDVSIVLDGVYNTIHFGYGGGKFEIRNFPRVDVGSPMHTILKCFMEFIENPVMILDFDDFPHLVKERKLVRSVW